MKGQRRKTKIKTTRAYRRKEEVEVTIESTPIPLPTYKLTEEIKDLNNALSQYSNLLERFRENINNIRQEIYVEIDRLDKINSTLFP